MRIRAPFDHGSVLLPTGEVYFVAGVAEVSESVGRRLLQLGYMVALNVQRPLREAKNILLIREAGLGDVLLVTPIIRLISSIGAAQGTVSIMAGEFCCLFDGSPHVHAAYTHKTLPSNVVDVFDYMAAFNKCEFEYDSRNTHRVDIFAKRIPGCPVPIPDKHLDYYVSAEEKAWAKSVLPDGKVAVMLLTANAPNRIYPMALQKQVSQSLVKMGYQVALVDAKWTGWDGPGITNLCKKTTIRQAAAIVDRADVVITPDSGFLHIAAALDRPTVCTVGAIDWKLRKTSDKTRFVHAEVECYPCNRYDCVNHKCLKELGVERVMEEVKALEDLDK